MGNSKGAIVLTLIVGVAIGFGLGRLTKGGHGDDGGGVPGVPGACLTPGPHIIDVGALGQSDCPEIVLSKSNNDSISWYSPQGSNLWVDIPGYSSNSSNNNAHFVIPQSYTPNKTATPIAFSVRVFGTGTPTPGLRTPTPPPQMNGRIIIMK